VGRKGGEVLGVWFAEYQPTKDFRKQGEMGRGRKGFKGIGTGSSFRFFSQKMVVRRKSRKGGGGQMGNGRGEITMTTTVLVVP